MSFSTYTFLGPIGPTAAGANGFQNLALYARYSTDNQGVASIEDQFRVCREHAGREAWQVIDTYHDAAISGGKRNSSESAA